MFYKYFRFFLFYKENNLQYNNFSRDNKIYKKRIFDNFMKQNLLFSLTRLNIFIETCKIASNFNEITIFEITDSIVKSLSSKQKTLNVFGMLEI